MLAKRIIPCLDIKNGRTVKGVNFLGLRDAGDPIELGALYAQQGADELTFLDITATIERRETFASLVRRIAHRINIPFTVGGGIKSVDDVKELLNAGADKITINSAAVYRPELITEIANQCGSQCVVVAIDSKNINGVNYIHTHGGKTSTDINTLNWVKEIESRGAGEILLTSMDHDGVKEGFANDLNRTVSELVNIPLIASGGAGAMSHFKDAFMFGGADAGLAASIFHFKEISIPELKDYLRNQKISIR